MQPLDQKPAIAGGKPVRAPDRFLVFGAPSIGEEEIAEVVETLRGGWIGTGPRVARFEADFAAYTHSPQAVAVASFHHSIIRPFGSNIRPESSKPWVSSWPITMPMAP